MGSESKFWFQIPVQLLTSCVTLDEFLNLSVSLFPYQYSEYKSMYVIDWFVSINELIHVQSYIRAWYTVSSIQVLTVIICRGKVCTGYSGSTEQKNGSLLVRQWERGGFVEEVMPWQILKPK